MPVLQGLIKQKLGDPDSEQMPQPIPMGALPTPSPATTGPISAIGSNVNDASPNPQLANMFNQQMATSPIDMGRSAQMTSYLNALNQPTQTQQAINQFMQQDAREKQANDLLDKGNLSPEEQQLVDSVNPPPRFDASGSIGLEEAAESAASPIIKKAAQAADMASDTSDMISPMFNKIQKMFKIGKYEVPAKNTAEAMKIRDVLSPGSPVVQSGMKAKP